MTETEADDATVDLQLRSCVVCVRDLRGGRNDDDWAGCTPRDIGRDASQQGRARSVVPNHEEGRLSLMRECDQPVRGVTAFDRYLGVLGRSHLVHEFIRCVVAFLSLKYMRIDERQLVALGQLTRHFGRADGHTRGVDAADYWSLHVQTPPARLSTSVAL
jgi:hypothetical protein